ncbi:GT-D fold domain-containing glycosyltransferase [Paenibacillus sp. BC26]|uniref:GT-D fold domain-containing protein n=1 Tax=Paenibacillus sp. BC26 TaxID=1881032 RepID=UPI0008EF6A2C|nr:GT-D fold domain-containing glycosyltransferase [Paenibacillus sp. BC26]SFS50727.1 hypothetical protein SAMN05428962_0496 [Paenibacillus sp. BC26]
MKALPRKVEGTHKSVMLTSSSRQDQGRVAAKRSVPAQKPQPQPQQVHALAAAKTSGGVAPPKSVKQRAAPAATGGRGGAANAGQSRKSSASGPKKRTRGRKSSLVKKRGRRRRQRDSALQPGMEHGQFHDNAFTAGYELGKYEGGELLLEQVLPMNLLLPEVRLQDVIALGAEQLRPRCLPLMDVHEVYAEMEQAIHDRRPCAVVRLGDGELLTLAQDVVYDTATIQREGTFLPYAGVNPPDLLARDQLLHAIRHAHIVGVPLARRKHFHPLLHPVFRAHHLDPGTLRMTNSTVNYGLSQTGLLGSLLAGKQLLVIGNAAPALAHMLSERGFIVSGLISPVRGVRDVERVILESRHVVFDLALVSAGIAAVMICTRIAHERGKTALDFGHMADALVKGQIALTH